MKQEISTEIKQELVKQALAARKFAYVPYSKFRVGAAALERQSRRISAHRAVSAARSCGNSLIRTNFSSFSARATVPGKK